MVFYSIHVDWTVVISSSSSNTTQFWLLKDIIGWKNIQKGLIDQDEPNLMVIIS